MTSGNVSVLLGNGDGTFAGNLDGDGHLDLATANEWSHNVSVLLQR
ncbi:hypothetical protein ACFL59_08265 [Planctomycetota bacterium]